MMKKSISLLVIVLVALSTTAQSDFDVAQSFMSKKGVKLAYNERSLTRGTDTPYSIFNGSEDKGFCIVVNGKVVGYDTENTANVDDLPIQLKEMLEEYSKMSSSAKTRGTDHPDWYTPKDVTPIEPMVKTKWNQWYPYNEWCPMGVKETKRRDGTIAYDTIHCPVGCCGTALAQIMSYYKPKGTVAEIPADYGVVVRFCDGRVRVDLGKALPATDFKWDLMRDVYSKNDELTEEEVDAIAELMVYCARMCTTSWDVSAGWGNIWDYRTYGYFGYNEDEIYRFDTTEELSDYDLYDKYLEQGYPLLSGANDHAFVVDGRNEIGMYHVNFGWGGSSDGYYILYNGFKYQHTNTGGAKSYEIKGRNLVFLTKPNQTTGVNSVAACTKPSDDSVYNLQGRKVGNSLEGLPKGVYIQKKKKVLK